MKNKKLIIGWAGFSDNKIYKYFDKEYYKGVRRLSIFSNCRDAKKCFEDVRKIEIKELK